MSYNLRRYKTLILVAAGLLALFSLRTILAASYRLPGLNDLFTATAVVGSMVVLIQGYRCLHRRDWVVAILLGGAVGVGMYFATLFSPYPFFGIVDDPLGQGLVRGCCAAIAILGGLVIMRQDGPVQFSAANGAWRKLGVSVILGLAIGAPLAVLNVFALQFTTSQAISWQNPFSALPDALQPAVVEEVIYRFAFLGLIWLALRKSLPDQAVWLSGLLALLVHNFMHFDNQLINAPWAALGTGLVLALVWGLPPTILALRRDLDSAIAFHWIQDAARFLAGF